MWGLKTLKLQTKLVEFDQFSQLNHVVEDGSFGLALTTLALSFPHFIRYFCLYKTYIFQLLSLWIR